MDPILAPITGFRPESHTSGPQSPGRKAARRMRRPRGGRRIAWRSGQRP